MLYSLEVMKTNDFELYKDYVDIFSSYACRAISRRRIYFKDKEDLLFKLDILAQQDARYIYSIKQLIIWLKQN